MIINVFPNEASDLRVLSTKLKKQFGYSADRLVKSTNAIYPQCHFKKHYPLPVRSAAVSLYVRCLRRFRQILSLCEFGQADGADVICRSMFESYLALAFLARQSVRLRKRTGNKPINQFGNALTQDFRAALFHAHCLFKHEKYLMMLKEVPRTKRFAARRLKTRPTTLNVLSQRLGPDWTKAVRNSNTCAGLSVEDLSHSVGAYQWYRVIYGDQSASVHSSDAGRYLIFEDQFGDPTIHLLSPLWEVAKVLRASNGLLGLCLAEFSRFLDLKHQRYVDSKIFECSWQEVKEVFKGTENL